MDGTRITSSSQKTRNDATDRYEVPGMMLLALVIVMIVVGVQLWLSGGPPR